MVEPTGPGHWMFMQLPITLTEIGPRVSAGAFILNSGLGKRQADDNTAAQLHGFAAGTYPFLQNLEPKQFVKVLSATEIAIGATLLAPVVPAAVAGAVLTGFSAGLLGLYLRTPGMRKPGSLAPTEQGLAIAKDVWLLGIGVGLFGYGTLDRRAHRSQTALALERAKKTARKRAKKARRAIS